MLCRQALIQTEQEECNETVKFLKFCKLTRHKCESVEEWIKRLQIAAKECSYQEHDRWVKVQFIYGINDDNIQVKINSELTGINNVSNITSKQVFMWAKLEGAWRTHTVEGNQLDKQICQTSPCRYCGSSHPPKDV